MHLREHWGNFVLSCLHELDVDSQGGRYEVRVGTHDRKGGFIFIDVGELDSDFLPLAAPESDAALRSYVDVLEVFNARCARRLEIEARVERRRKAIASLTAEQREALGL